MKHISKFKAKYGDQLEALEGFMVLLLSGGAILCVAPSIIFLQAMHF